MSLVISANNSLSTSGTWLFYGSIFAGTAIISGGWASLGYWPVLPFAGVELALLAGVLLLVRHRAAYREILVIGADEVTLERGRSSQRETLQWPRTWLRTELRRASRAGQRSRLMLCASGEQVEVGRMLTDQERRSLHARLRELLRR